MSDDFLRTFPRCTRGRDSSSMSLTRRGCWRALRTRVFLSQELGSGLSRFQVSVPGTKSRERKVTREKDVTPEGRGTVPIESYIDVLLSST